MSAPFIVPHLWFEKNAAEAARFYVSVFPDSLMGSVSTLGGTPSGDVELVSFRIFGCEVRAIAAGPEFRLNQAVSFFAYCGSDSEIERIYEALMQGGTAVFPLGSYPWNSKYAWVIDRYGLSWQLDKDDIRSPQKIVPTLLFANTKMHAVGDALPFYASLFNNGRMLFEAPYDPSAGMPEGTLLFAQVKLGSYILNAMSSNQQHDFDFNEAFSLMIICETQQEIDFYWEKLSDGGEIQPCGWVKDRYGFSWQIVPAELDKMMSAGPEASGRVMAELMTMTRPDISRLRKAAMEG